ncbi:MAG: hypothetical protein A6F70_03135 [Cycloclasticus sp. symbiont of Bathymodiolus heckerae]|nr:MAG: hypothetical protein A6F70_03135 [Cycloclasticus sp. symbiont of Bathymodiolus heckerae]
MESRKMEHKQLEAIEYSRHDDEIDLFELFAPLIQQWRWLVGITLAGVLISAAVALSMPKQYEVTAKIASPNATGVAAISVRGYGSQTAGPLFEKFHKSLTSDVQLNNFVATGQWDAKLYPVSAGGKATVRSRQK